MRALACLLLIGSAHAQGFSLVESVDDLWRRIEDRHGRLDPDGALLQLHDPLQYTEYAFDRQLMRWPLHMEAAWVAAEHKARFFVHSLDEFQLTNELQLETGAPLGGWGRFGLRVDRVERREGQSTLVRTDFGAEDIASSGWFAGVSLTPRWEKEDVDLELFAGVEGDAGRLRLRLIALDAFVDAAHALAEGRDAPAARAADQQDAPLAWAVDFQSARIHGVRAEVYAGVVLPASTRYRFTRSDEPAFERRREAALGGGLLEWQQGPLWVGVAATQVVANTEWRGGRQARVAERVVELKAYALARLGEVQLDAECTRSAGRSDGAEDNHEVRLLSGFRAYWQPGPVGLELGLFRADRDVVRGPDLPEEAQHRLITRALFQWGPQVWIGLGTGWDLDAGDGVYDGSGFTLVATL